PLRDPRDLRAGEAFAARGAGARGARAPTRARSRAPRRRRPMTRIPRTSRNPPYSDNSGTFAGSGGVLLALLAAPAAGALGFLVVAAAAAMVLFGVQELRDEKLDVFPEFAPTQVQVQTEALGLSASEVEQLVTVPLENALNGAPGVTDVRSESVPQLSAITLLFKGGSDLLQARRWVQERLQAVSPTLPTWAASPVMMPPVSATSRIMAVGVRSHSLSPRDLSMLAFWTIRARLLRVPGVANVAIWGERPKQLQVRAEPRRLQAQGISLQRLMDAASGAVENGLLRFVPGSVVGTGGFVDTPS